MAGLRRAWFGISVLTAAVLAACGGGGGQDGGREQAPAEQAPAGQESVDVTLEEYAFLIGGPLKAGGTFRLRNTGKECHMMALGKLKAGKTLDDLKQALAQAPPPGP